jgi:hypothetical protein
MHCFVFEQALTKEAAAMEAEAPKQAAKAQQLTQQLTKEEEVWQASEPTALSANQPSYFLSCLAGVGWIAKRLCRIFSAWMA